MSRRSTTAYLLALCLTLSGCGDKLLERSYSSLTPHSAAYRETEDANTLRAENYQDLVNALLILLGDHSEGGIVRIYGDAQDKAELAENACVEVQKETPIGAYLLDYITYDGKAESSYYELTVRFGYRRTAEEQAAIVNATSTEALPDLLRAAIDEGRDAAVIRVGYFGTDRAGVMALVASVHDEVYPPEETEPDGEGEAVEAIAPPGADIELSAPPPEETEPDLPPEDPVDAAVNALIDMPPDLPEKLPADMPPDVPVEPPPDEPSEPAYDLSPWQVLFYPDGARPGIIEVILRENPDA